MSELVELIAGDEPGSWERLGFAVDADGTCRVGGLVVRLDGGGGGVREWVLRGSGPEAIDGLPTRWTSAAAPGSSHHPNGALALDHIVVFTDDRERTAGAMEAAGGDVRRRRDPPAVPLPMAFVRLGAAIVEVAQTPEGPARFWGLVAVVRDLDAVASELGDRLGSVRPAVQPGQRIATVRAAAAGIEVPLAFMSPREGSNPVRDAPGAA